jgi:hypothetical protein
MDDHDAGAPSPAPVNIEEVFAGRAAAEFW